MRKPQTGPYAEPYAKTLCGTLDGPYAEPRVSPIWRNLRRTLDGPYTGLRRALDGFSVAGGRSGRIRAPNAKPYAKTLCETLCEPYSPKVQDLGAQPYAPKDFPKVLFGRNPQ